MSERCPSDRAILTVMQLYRMTEADVRESYMDEVQSAQRLIDKGIDLHPPEKDVTNYR